MIEKTDSLVSQVAALLAGRPVEVRHLAPPYSTALGCAIKSAGRAIVYIHPGTVDWETRFSTFLHELAHIREHWAVIPDTDHATRPAGSMASKNMIRLGDYIGQPVEDQADQLAAAWLKFAKSNRDIYADDLAEGLLRGLLKWQPPATEAVKAVPISPAAKAVKIITTKGQ